MRLSTLLLALLIAVADQASKWLILLHVMSPPRVIEVTPFFNLVLAYNTGIAFSIGAAGARWSSFIFAGLAIVIIIGLTLWLSRQTSRLVHIAGGLVIGGAIGNVIDRSYIRAWSTFWTSTGRAITGRPSIWRIAV